MIAGTIGDVVRAKQQRECTDNSPHLIVEARAGTGKTTTLIEGLKIIKGMRSQLVPSPQQKAIWEAMALSAGKVNSIGFVAFNKSIADELQRRVPAGCTASTMHSMGNSAVRRVFPRLRDPNKYRVPDIIGELLKRDPRELKKYEPTLLAATEELVTKCKQNLVAGADDEELAELAAYYDIDLNGSASKVFDLVPRVLERCKDVDKDACIDFNDMIWLPIVLQLPVYRYDLLLVDEAQDLNRCQQQLALLAGRRLILCGDPKQAIYGFAGADAESLPRMHGILNEGVDEGGRGCQLLPLTVTRRCGRAIVEEARQLVPDFEAHESNSAGKVQRAGYTVQSKDCDKASGHVFTYHTMVEDGDFILCRCNAPLVSQCFRFLKAGRKANIQGRDIGTGLIKTIEKMKAKDVTELVEKLYDWYERECQKENAKKHPNDNRLIALQDRKDCLECFCQDAQSVQEVIDKINKIFTDDKNSAGIRLSSVHKAKGLEAKRVFILLIEGAQMPHPMAKSPWQREQEMNLKYVAITRAIEELVYVS